MKIDLCSPRLLFVGVSAMLLTGCLLKPARVSTRHYVLAPIPAGEPSAAAKGDISVGIGFVKMPSELLRDSVAVRTGANELQFLEDDLWAGRLDQCFQRTLAANLSQLLSSDNIYTSDWGRDQVQARVFINVQQFDVDTQGRGTLVAQWRIAASDGDMALRSGRAMLERTGASPHGKPEVIAATMSDLTADFSRELAQSLRQSLASSSLSPASAAIH
jgi:uncharacterized lipoprotein YmbA